MRCSRLEESTVHLYCYGETRKVQQTQGLSSSSQLIEYQRLAAKRTLIYARFWAIDGLFVWPRVKAIPMAWLDYVGIPYLALLALAVIEGHGGWDSLSRKVIELGIDACILGIGVSGALFASDPVRVKLGNGTTGIAIAAILAELIIVGLCLHLRTWRRWSERARASASLFLGVSILIANSEIVWRCAS